MFMSQLKLLYRNGKNKKYLKITWKAAGASRQDRRTGRADIQAVLATFLVK